MLNEKKILAIIPARGGSKGVPGKNIKNLLGKPLITWTIDVLKLSKYIDRIFVSTDSKEIRNIAVNNEIEVPFLRNELLAKDNSLVIDAVIEAIDYFSSIGEMYDIVLLFEPTSPMRNVELVDEAITILKENTEIDSIATFSEIELPLERIWLIENNSPRLMSQSNNAFKPRQQLSVAYKLNGLLYGIRVNVLKSMAKPQIITDNVFPLITKRDISTDIDDMSDFEYIEFLMSKNENNFNNRG
ncbi:cytidylyltransferase domain-containing protein [Alistipes sp. ZOR0009]|uniref:acylneuraminate cytidylyltransferase family protein n=1 Tax=Alistipes sp. ZOR0009 TaxID=1339253 RepID=UPI000645CAB1|nr:acylneuraminate cytidylyltransferase family protein [Alistipes sp. ZOR0009]